MRSLTEKVYWQVGLQVWDQAERRAASRAANQKQISVNNNMENNQFVQFSMADGYYWIWQPIIAIGNKIGYRKVRLATEEEIKYEKLRTDR